MNLSYVQRTNDWQWITIAVIIGLSIAILPLQLSIVLVGIVGLIALVLIEPIIAFVAMLAVAPLKTLIETEASLSLPVDIGQLALVFAVGVWLLHKISLRQNFQSIKSLPVFIPILAFVIATMLTLPNAYSFGAGLNEWLKWIEILVLVYIVADFAAGRWQWFIFGIVLAAVIQSLIGIYEFRGGSGAPHLWILDFRYFRAFGTFGQPNPFGAFLGLILPLSLGTTWGYSTTAWSQYGDESENSSRWHISAGIAFVYAIFSGIILLGLLVSWSRGAWLGFGAASFTLLWLAPRRLWHGTLLILGVVFFAFILWVNGRLPVQVVQRVTDFSEDFTGFQDVRGVVISDDNFAVVERLAHWQSAIDMAEKRPWLGVGFGNYEAAYDDFALINWPIALGHAHNYYLNLLAETGILGLSVYGIMWGALFVMTWRVLRRTDLLERGIALGLMGVWVHLSVHSLVDKLYVNNSFLHFGVMLGLLAVLQRHLNESESIGS